MTKNYEKSQVTIFPNFAKFATGFAIFRKHKKIAKFAAAFEPGHKCKESAQKGYTIRGNKKSIFPTVKSALLLLLDILIYS